MIDSLIDLSIKFLSTLHASIFYSILYAGNVIFNMHILIKKTYIFSFCLWSWKSISFDRGCTIQSSLLRIDTTNLWGTAIKSYENDAGSRSCRENKGINIIYFSSSSDFVWYLCHFVDVLISGLLDFRDQILNRFCLLIIQGHSKHYT